jgi:hypothetical protein
MVIESYILKLVHTDKGEVVIIDFPPDFIPHLGMELTNRKDCLRWKIMGIGLPVIIDLLEENIESHYNSSRVWDCLLIPIGHDRHLNKEMILEVE